MFTLVVRSKAAPLSPNKIAILAFALCLTVSIFAAISALPARSVAAPQTQELAHQKMTAVEAGNAHILAIRADGTLWSWGDNNYGQLGLGETNEASETGETDGGAARAQSIPQAVRIPEDSAVVAVAAGAAHSLAIDDAGRLWAWGKGAKGRLGLGDTHDRSTPSQVNTAPQHTWQAISAGGGHSLALTSDGSLWAWGENGFGQLGIGNRDDQSVPQQVTVADGPSNWKAVSAGSDYSLALTSAGILYAWGSGASGRLGLGSLSTHTTPQQVGDTDIQWTDISAGWNHVLAVRSDGSLWTWGGSEAGQLGTGDRGVRTAPTRITAANNWVSVSAGFDHSSALDTEGQLWLWGSGAQGQLGMGATTDTLTPTQIQPASAGAQWKWTLHAAGKGFTYAYDSVGAPYNWGWNTFGQSGSGVFCENLLVPAADTYRGNPFRMAAAPAHKSRHDWAPSKDATIPTRDTENLAIDTGSITLYFDRPMSPGFGTIEIDQQASVNTTAGQWSDSQYGPNTVFTAPMTLHSYGTEHTAVASDFIDAQFGQGSSNEAYPISITFTTEPPEEREIIATGLTTGSSALYIIIAAVCLLALCVFARARRRHIENFAALHSVQESTDGQSPTPHNSTNLSRGRGAWS